jgi:hypothetical protein
VILKLFNFLSVFLPRASRLNGGQVARGIFKPEKMGFSLLAAIIVKLSSYFRQT